MTLEKQKLRPKAAALQIVSKGQGFMTDKTAWDTQQSDQEIHRQITEAYQSGVIDSYLESSSSKRSEKGPKPKVR